MTAVIYGQCQSSYGRHVAVINDFCWDPWRRLLFYMLVQPKYLGWDRNICYCFGSAALQLNFKWISEKCDSFYSPPWFMRGGRRCDQCRIRVWWLALVFVIGCIAHDQQSIETTSFHILNYHLIAFFVVTFAVCQPPPHSLMLPYNEILTHNIRLHLPFVFHLYLFFFNMISLPLQSSERARLQNLIKLSVAAVLYVKSIFFYSYSDLPLHYFRIHLLYLCLQSN